MYESIPAKMARLLVVTPNDCQRRYSTSKLHKNKAWWFDCQKRKPETAPTDGASGGGDRANILSIIAKCHDGHQALLLAEEAKIQSSVRAWAEEFLAVFREKELKRNRTRYRIGSLTLTVSLVQLRKSRPSLSRWFYT